jgi:hypothetical protein
MPIVCRKNLSQSDLTDCKIITIEGEEKVFLVGNKGRFTLQWKSAPVGQEFQPKTWLFQARDGMPEKM